MAMKIVEVDFAVANNLQSLTLSVNSWIKEGDDNHVYKNDRKNYWQPQGGVTVDPHGNFIQLMVRIEDDGRYW